MRDRKLRLDPTDALHLLLAKPSGMAILCPPNQEPEALSMASGVEGASRAHAAVLFADVHRYSLLMARDEARTFARVLEARKLCEHLIGNYGGRVVQTVGDAIFALFPACEQAVRFALAFQADLASASIWRVDEEPLRFRIGIHWGEVVQAGGDVYGYAISIAERLQHLATPGGVCVSDAVRTCIEEARDLAWRSLGWRRLHNIDDAVLAYASDRCTEETAPPVPLLPEPAAAGEASLAVLPFEPLSSDPSD